MREPLRRGLVLGCGGTVGAAWTVGALIALEEALAWDARQATALVGTSAGATLAALLGGGVSARALLDAQLGGRAASPAVTRFFAAPPARWPPRPRLRLTAPRLLGSAAARAAGAVALSALAPEGTGQLPALAALADTLPLRDGWVPHPATWIMALDAATGERTALGSPHAPRCTLADALAASWAIPGWFAPVHIGDRRYLDSGVASPSSADVLAPLALDEVVVIAPMASPDGACAPGVGGRVEGLLRRVMTRALERERRVLLSAGTRVRVLSPSAEDLAAMGAQLMDGRRRLAAVEVALRSCRRALAQRPMRRAHAMAPARPAAVAPTEVRA